jgi:hypothetical protein
MILFLCNSHSGDKMPFICLIMLENIQKLEDGRERWETGQRGQSKTLPDLSLFEMGVI